MAAGGGSVGSFLAVSAIVVGTAIVAGVGALFFTGVAQERILPGITGEGPERAAADSAFSAGDTPAPLRDEIEEALAPGAPADAGDADRANATVDGEAAGSRSDAGGSDTAARELPPLTPVPPRPRAVPVTVAAGTAATPEAALLAQIETARSALDEERAELASMRASIDSLAGAFVAARDENVQRQAKLLAGMKSDEAGKVLAAMDDPTVRVILASMNARAASAVLAELDPRRAARISAHGIRGRAATAPAPSAGLVGGRGGRDAVR